MLLWGEDAAFLSIATREQARQFSPSARGAARRSWIAASCALLAMTMKTMSSR
jgi:hypothetical protein